MAVENTPGSDSDNYVDELNRRHERFLALGGGKDLQMEIQGWTPLKDLVTAQHRKIVFDLCSSGISNEAVADVMGISKERLQSLFPTEIATAYQLCHASLARSLYWQGISGDGKAAADWLRLHNRSKWAAKTQVSGTEDGAAIKTEEVGSARNVLAELLTGMATDRNMRGATKEVKRQDTTVQETPAQKPARGTKVVRKVKQE